MMSFEQTEWVWMNGEVINWGDATVHVSTHALHYGTGVFEGMRCYETDAGPAVFRLHEHLERFYASAQVYGLEFPYTREQLARGTCEMIRRNNFLSCYIRLIGYYGSGTLGLDTQKCPAEVAVFGWPWAAYLGGEKLETGVRVTVSSWVKFHSRMMPTTAKACGQYLNSFLATRDALRQGYDEAIMLDGDGNIAEGPGENLFVVRNGTLITNDERSSILLGVTRDAVLQIARHLHYPVEIRTLALADLLSADEAFFTGTAVEVMPIREVDSKPVGNGARGPVTEHIQRTFFRCISNKEPGYDWLHFVKE